MEVRALEKYIRISPKKARLVADVVRGQNAVSAMTTLKFMPKKAAGIISKALNSAISNAVNNHGLAKNDLVIAKISVDSGPSLKRFRPRSKGMASPILKRTSHVTVVVSAETPPKNKKQSTDNKPEAKVEKEPTTPTSVSDSTDSTRPKGAR